MDPIDPGGRPPDPERPPAPAPPGPPRPPGPPPARVGRGGPPGGAPPGRPAGAPSPPGPPAWVAPAPPAPPGWGPPPVPQGPPGWGTPGPPPPRRRAGWILVALAGLLVAAMVATVLILRPGDQAGPSPRLVGQRPAITLAPDPRAELPQLLAKRAKALLVGDRAAFLATVDRRQRTYYRQQATLYARMRAVPFSAYTYRLTSDLRSRPNLKRRYAAAQVYQAQVQARYRFKDQDTSPVLARHSFTFVRTDDGWRIAGPGDRRQQARDDVEIWDGGPVRTARSARTLIVHHPGQEQLAGRLLGAADRAYAQVGAAWTGRWERKAVILVPRDQAEAERLVGARDLTRVAAVASSSVESGAAERVLGNRIVVNTTNVTRYNELSLQILVTHEMTHVATRTLGVGVPLLLVEGFADWAALMPVKLPFAVTRATLFQQVRSGRFDGTLPGDREFRGPDAGVAYDEGSAFCLWVARTYGVAKLRALYREFAGTSPANSADLDRGFRHVLGLPRRTAEGRWAAWVRDQG